ncbi:hypothetical protein IBX65_08085, partial [Candidatus Aerophobetes bacterium]|nr:hypothetical protein [Candidatus Aerophobetes bacterium]
MEEKNLFYKVDLHVHSHYSELEGGILKTIIPSESYTSPVEVYKMAKKRGMNLVTITDHNSIDGALEIAHLPDVFISEEVTATFPEDNCPIHVIALNINQTEHKHIQELKANIYELVKYFTSQKTLNFVAHPFSSVNGQLKKEHWEKMLLLFDVFEVRNGTEKEKDNLLLEKILASLSPGKIEELANRYNIASLSKTSWKKSMVGGSDDHGGLYIAKTYTLGEGPDLESFLKSIKEGKCRPEGSSGTYFKIGHSIYATGYKFYKDKLKKKKKATWLGFLDKIVNDERKGKIMEKVFIRNGRRGIPFLPRNFLIAYFIKKFSRKIPFLSALTVLSKLNRNLAFYVTLSPYLFGFAYQNKGKSFTQEIKTGYLNQEEPLKVAVFTDIMESDGTSCFFPKREHVLSEAEEIEIVSCVAKKGISQNGCKLFRSVAHFPFPLYPQIHIYVPPLLEVLSYCEQKEFTALHALTPGPMGITAIIVSKVLKLPIIGTYHSDFFNFAGLILPSSNNKSFENFVWQYLRWFYS